MRIWYQGRRELRTGSVMLEFVISFPLLLTLFLACIQISLLWIARMTVNYAAYCGARAALVSAESEALQAAEQAARMVCSFALIGSSAGEAQSSELVLPGLGRVAGSGSRARKVRVRMLNDSDFPPAGVPPWNIGVKVEMDYALATPIVGPMLAWGMNPWDKTEPWKIKQKDETNDRNIGEDSIPYPHVILSEKVLLPKPFVSITRTDWAFPVH